MNPTAPVSSELIRWTYNPSQADGPFHREIKAFRITQPDPDLNTLREKARIALGLSNAEHVMLNRITHTFTAKCCKNPDCCKNGIPQRMTQQEGRDLYVTLLINSLAKWLNENDNDHT